MGECDFGGGEGCVRERVPMRVGVRETRDERKMREREKDK